MKNLHGINIFITISLWVSTYYFIAWKEELWAEFSRVGWEKYEGENLKTPTIYFSRLMIGSIVFAFYLGIQTYMKHDWRWIGVLLCIVAGMSFFLELLVLAKEIHLSQRQVWRWQTLFICNIVLSVIAFLKLEYKKTAPPISNDILDDPNSITNHES